MKYLTGSESTNYKTRFLRSQPIKLTKERKKKEWKTSQLIEECVEYLTFTQSFPHVDVKTCWIWINFEKCLKNPV